MSTTGLFIVEMPFLSTGKNLSVEKSALGGCVYDGCEVVRLQGSAADEAAVNVRLCKKFMEPPY